MIGQYVSCALCDREAVPEHVQPEKTEPLCPNCGSDQLADYPGMVFGGLQLVHCHNCETAHNRRI